MAVRQQFSEYRILSEYDEDVLGMIVTNMLKDGTGWQMYGATMVAHDGTGMVYVQAMIQYEFITEPDSDTVLQEA
jgi:hypothetical protein